MEIKINITKKRLIAIALICVLAFSSYEVGRAVTSLPIWNINGSPVSGADYTIGQYASNYTYFAESGDQQTWLNSQTIQPVFTVACQSGNRVFVENGSYSGVLSFTGINNVTLTFSSGALLTIPNGANVPVIWLVSCNNWVIQGGSINGNAVNQVSGEMNGIDIQSCQNVVVDSSNIYNCRQFGVYIWGTSVHCGVINSKLTFCEWNGITLGGGIGYDNDVGLYALNNEVAYSGDVGISLYGGYSTVVQNNYVHDMNGTLGYVNSLDGISVEGGGNTTIIGNIVSVGKTGITTVQEPGVTVTTGKNIISSNTIQYITQTGIQIDTDNNIVSGNQINQWDTIGTYQSAIYISGSNNQIIGNTMASSYPNAFGINLVSGNYNSVLDNSISATNGVATSCAIDISGAQTMVANNRIIGFAGGYGIGVEPGAINTAVKNNDVSQVTGLSTIKNSATTASVTAFYTNTGYNPVGYISTPIYNGTAFNYIVDGGAWFQLGNSSSWKSATTYTNLESPKTLDIVAGTVSVIAKNGQTIGTATSATVPIEITLQPGDTFSITFTVAPTIKVFGQ